MSIHSFFLIIGQKGQKDNNPESLDFTDENDDIRIVLRADRSDKSSSS